MVSTFELNFEFREQIIHIDGRGEIDSFVHRSDALITLHQTICLRKLRQFFKSDNNFTIAFFCAIYYLLRNIQIALMLVDFPMS